MSRKDRADERGDALVEGERDTGLPTHPSYDPSGDEPAGSNDGLPERSFAGTEYAEAEDEQARGRRESAATRDNTALGPHDQESGG